MIIRHVEFTIDFDLTCIGLDKEDFEGDTKENVRESVIDYILSDTGELIDYLEIKKVWYEEE